MPKTGYYISAVSAGNSKTEHPVAHVEDEELAKQVCEGLSAITPVAPFTLRYQLAATVRWMAWDSLLERARDRETLAEAVAYTVMEPGLGDNVEEAMDESLGQMDRIVRTANGMLRLALRVVPSEEELDAFFYKTGQNPSPPAGSPVNEAPRGTGKADAPAAPRVLPPAQSRAGASFEWVNAERPDLAPSEGSPTPYCKAQWEHIRENGCPAYEGPDGEQSKVPNFDTWTRYVRACLRVQEGPKRSPRAGRPHGSSIVRAEEREPQKRN